MSDQWLSEIREQIQVLDMELQIGLKVLTHRTDPKYVMAFMQVLARRDRMTASVISYLAKNQSLKLQVPEAKPEFPAQTSVKQHENEAVPHQDDNLAAVDTGKVIRFPRRPKNTR
jgi:hypothetical protein